MSKNIKGITIEIGGDTQPLNKALEDVNKKSRDLQSELRQVERLLKLDPKNTELLSQKQKLLSEAVANSREKLDRLKSTQEQVNEQFRRGEIGEEQYRAFQREVAKAEQELERLEKQLSDVNNKWKDAAEHLDKMGKKSVEVGKNLSTKVTAPIVGIGVAATKMGSDFVDALAKVSTLADTTQVSMDDLKKGILDISNASGVAATEVSESVYSALSAGVETSEVLGFIESNIMLVKAGFTEMGTAIDVTTTVMNAYGDAAYDVTKIGDILVKTQDEGKISVDELGKNLGRVIPTASSLGVNLDQLGASYAIMTAKGQNANIATTNLNSMLGELGKTGSKADKALREMTDKSFKELVADGKTVGDVLGLLSEYAEQAGLTLADMFGSTTAGSAALTLLSDGVDGFNESVDIMNNASGTMAENFEKLQTPSEELKIALNKIKNAMLDIAEATLPIMSKVAEAIGKVADKLLAMDEKTRNIILVIAGLAAAIGPVLIAFGLMAQGMAAVMGVVGGLSGLLPVLGAAIGAITAPVAAMVAALAILVAAGVALYKNWDEIVKASGKFWGDLKASWESGMEGIKKAFADFGANISDAWTKLWDRLKNFFDEWGKTILLLSVGPAGWAIILGQKLGISFEDIKNTTSRVWEGIKDAMIRPIEKAKNILDGIIQNIKNAFANMKITIPKPKLPHIIVDWREVGFGNAKVNIPSFGVNWYAKGGIFERPSIIGVGEAGTEAVIPLDKLPGMIREALQGEQLGYAGAGDIVIHNMTVRDNDDIKMLARELFNLQQQDARGRGLR